MSKILKLSILGLIAAAPASVGANSSTRLVAYVPVQCSVSVLDSAVSEGRVTMHVRRQCNAGHSIVIESVGALPDAELTMQYNASIRQFSAGRLVLPQAEGFYDQVDTLVVSGDRGAEDQLASIASTMSVSIEAG